ncbi:MAG: 50S ribosomal protein L24 [Lentisphaerae bacterium]|nr:50S ribosomal protein L24 [Lentisphaerota bacterium]
MSVATIKKNDTVICTRGISAGKTGKVLAVDRTKGRALVEGLNLVKKALRKSQDNPQGGIVDKEASIALANVRPFCPECKRGVRLRRRLDGDRRVRVCSSAGCKHVFDR